MIVYPSLYVGLGGTGRVVTAKIEQRFRQVFKNTRGKEIPPVIKFLGIDGDEASPKEGIDLPRDEILLIPVETEVAEKEIRANLTEEGKKDLRKDPVWGWYEFGLYDRIQRSTTSVGAGQIRKLARQQLFYNYKDVKGTLNNLVTVTGEKHPQIGQDWNVEIGSPLQCFISASIAGGTGSGSFWDLALLVKNLKPEAVINLILLTPEFFVGDILDTGQDTSIIYANAYACLKELNYFAKERSFTQTYASDEPPIELSKLWPRSRTMEDLRIFILTTRNEIGDVIGNRVDMGQLIADFCFYFTCAGVTSMWNSARANDHDLGRDWKYTDIPSPQPAIFSSIGLSQIIFPKELVISLLRIKSLKQLLNHILDSESHLSVARQEIEDGRTEITDGRERQIPAFLDRGHIIPLLVDPDFKLCDFERVFRGERKYRNKKEVKGILQGEKERVSKWYSRKGTDHYNYTEILNNFKNAINQLVQTELESGRNWNYIKEFLRLLIEKMEVLNNLYNRQNAYYVDHKEEEKEAKEKEKAFEKSLNDLDVNYPLLIKTWGRTSYHIRKVYDRIREHGKVILMYKQKEAMYEFYEQAIGYVTDLLNQRISPLESCLRNLRASLTEDERETWKQIREVGGGYVTKVKTSGGDLRGMYNDYLKQVVDDEKDMIRTQVWRWLDLQSRQWSMDSKDVEGWVFEEGEKISRMSEVTGINLSNLMPKGELKNLLYRHHEEHTKAYFDPGFKKDVAKNVVKEYNYALSKEDLAEEILPAGLGLTKVDELDPNQIIFIQIRDTMPIYRLGNLQQYYGSYNTHVNKERDPEKRYTFAHLIWEALDYPELLTSPNIQVFVEIAQKLQVLTRPKPGGPVVWKGSAGEVKYTSNRKLEEAFHQDSALVDNLQDDILYVLQDKTREEVKEFLENNKNLFNQVHAFAQRIRVLRGLQF